MIEKIKNLKIEEKYKDLIIKLLCEIERLDKNRLIISKKGGVDIELRNNIVDVQIDKPMRNSYNSLWFYFIITDTGEVDIREYITSHNCPKRGKYLYFIWDEIDFCFHTPPRMFLKENNISDIAKLIMLRGYSVWGNNWGYITKEGRKAYGTLRTRGICKIVKEESYSTFNK